MDLLQLYEWVNRQTGVWVWPAGTLGLAVLFVLALWMGAALANVEKLTFLRALWIGPILMAIVLPVGYAIFLTLFDSDMSQWLTLERMLIGVGLALAIDLVLVVGLMMALAESSPGQGLLVWILRLPILALLGALVSGAVFVGIAIYQALQEPRGQTWLVLIGWISAGVVALAVGLYFITRMTQAPISGPRRKTP